MKIWWSVVAIVFGFLAVPAGLIMQAMAWNCENGCGTGFLLLLVKALTAAGFIALVLGPITLFIQLAGRDDSR